MPDGPAFRHLVPKLYGPNSGSENISKERIYGDIFTAYQHQKVLSSVKVEEGGDLTS
jgi:hypothetical protein